LELDGNISYIFVYLYKAIEQFARNHNSNILEKKLLMLNNLYGRDYPKVINYSYRWLGDAFLFTGDYVSAWKYTRMYPSKDWARHLVDFINLSCRDKNQTMTVEEIDSIFSISEALTDFGNNNLENIKKTIDLSLIEFHKLHGENLLYYYLNKNKIKKEENEKKLFTGIMDVRLTTIVSFKYSKSIYKNLKNQIFDFLKECENKYRMENNLPRIGEGWISETVLYYQLKEIFPNFRIIAHAKPDFLGLQHLDIFFPELDLAIEYQGVQHNKPVSIFGGEKTFELTKERDARKKELCEQNGVCLLYVYPEYKLQNVTEEIIRAAEKKGEFIEINKALFENTTLSQIKQDFQGKKKLYQHTEVELSSAFKKTFNESKKLSKFEDIQFLREIEPVKEMLRTSKTVLDKIFNQNYLLSSYYRHCYRSGIWTQEFEDLGLELINSYQTTYEEILKLDTYEVSFDSIEWRVNDFRGKVAKNPGDLKYIIDSFLLRDSFEYMAKAYTYQEEYEQAISISQLALSHGIKGSGKTGFEGRIERLKKKL